MGNNKLYAMYTTKDAEHPLDRLITGYECLRMQAFPMPLIDLAKGENQPSDPQMCDLAGNAFTSTVVAAIIMALLSSFPKQRGELQADEPDAASTGSDLDMIASLLTG